MTGRFSRFGSVALLLLVVAAVPALAGQPPAGVSGVVRDARGTPQVGALVELLRADSSVTVLSAFTDEHGRYLLSHVAPGQYSVKATASLFLPTLRENLSVNPHSRAVVNLTLNTLFEAFQWLPAKRRPVDESKDDWAWTLRSSTNRPLLRMLDDGPLVVVSGADGGSALKARVTLHGGANEFGAAGLHHAFEVERSNEDNGSLILRADVSSDDLGGLASATTLVGYEQQLSPGTTFRAVASMENLPSLQRTSTDQGMQALVVRTAETLRLTDSVTAEVGNQFEAVHMGQELVTSHPFGGMSVSEGDTTLSYRVTTALGLQQADRLDQDVAAAPMVSESNGALRVEHGLHQEVVFERDLSNGRVEVLYYRDRVLNPVVRGGGELSHTDLNSGDVIFDPLTGLLSVTGGDYSGQGFEAEYKRKLSSSTWLSLGMADGDALAMAVTADPRSLQDGLAGLKPQRAQMYWTAMNGRIPHAGTHWRTSYRWQPGNTVTAVAPFDSNAPDAFLSFYLRQPLHCGHMLPNGMEALVDVRNLLAQGYRPFITSDGSTLYFAQAERSIHGGVSFTF